MPRLSSSTSMALFNSLGFWFFALSLTALTGVADAHNWLINGRSNPLGGRYANTNLPCPLRKTTDTFAQVGKNQRFTFRWEANHNADAYVIVVAGKHERKLADPRITEYVREYLDDAKKEGKNLAQQPKYMRYRGGTSSHINSGSLDREIARDDSLFMDHDFVETINQWSYKGTSIANDLRANYHNSKFPWLEAAALYPTIYQSPADSEIVSIDISGHTEGLGHYVAHWSWNGYGDCTDFDLHEDIIPTDLVYGDVTEGFTFNRVDHCHFQDFMRVLSAPVEVNEDMTISDCLAADKDSTGVNVVPAKLPAAAQRLLTPNNIAPVWKHCANTGFGGNNFPFCACDGQIRYGSLKADKWSDLIIDLSKRPDLKRDGNAARKPDGEDQIGHVCNIDTFGPDPWLDPVLGDDKACYCKSRATKPATNNIPWATAPLGFESDWMTLTGTVSMSQQDAAYWDVWKGRTTVTPGGTCDNIWSGELSLWDAVKRCDLNTDCAGLSWKNPDSQQVTALYTGKHEFRGCKGKAKSGGDNAWTSLDRKFTDPKSASGPQIKIKFQNADQPDVAGWSTDSGEVFGPRDGGESYGWRCPYPGMQSRMDTQYCPGGLEQVWEMKVPNGVYEISEFFNFKAVGCWVENVRVGSYKHEVSFQVPVTDGRLTFGAAFWRHGHATCERPQKFLARKVFETVPESWLPATKNPWVQVSLNDQSVGVVKVTPDRLDEASSKWLFEGNSILPFTATGCSKGDNCNGFKSFTKGIIGRWDDLTQNGAVVGLSDKECKGDTECTPTTICGVIDEQTKSKSSPSSNFYVDCKGATGKYLYVQLPGDRRILDFDLTVFRDEPLVNSKGNPIDEDTLVCYSVQAQLATTTAPEFVITNDPEDANFYSTCFVRVPIIEWLATSKPLKTPRWKWHNSCLDCDDYQKNEVSFETIDVLTPLQWHMSDQCRNCDDLNL